MCSKSVAFWFSVALTMTDANRVSQSETVFDRLDRGASGRVQSLPSGRTPTITEILRETDLIVRGTVGQARAYLSDDRRDIYTEYTIERPSLLFGALPISSGMPGSAQPQRLAVSQLGGTINLNGRTFTHTVNGLQALPQGAEVLLLLKTVGERLQIAFTYYGAFGIQDGTIAPLVTRDDFVSEYRNVPATTALADMIAKAHSSKQ